jgi:hypothetical protein
MWVVREVHEMLLVFLIHVLAGSYLVKVRTGHVARQASRDFLPHIQVRSEETVRQIYSEMEVKGARDTKWYREKFSINVKPEIIPPRRACRAQLYNIPARHRL